MKTNKFRILHILPNSIYSSYFIDFVEENFPHIENFYIVYGKPLSNFSFKTLDKHRIIFANRSNIHKSFRNIQRFLIKSNHIIFHGLFLRAWHYVILGMFIKLFRKKTSWAIWGADAYQIYLEKEAKTKHTFTERVKKIFAKDFSYVVTGIPNDYQVAKKYYNLNSVYINAFYPNPVNFDLLDKTATSNSTSKERKGKVVILVGNSASKTNNHIEILIALSKKYKNDSIQILCPLSYGDKDYSKEVIRVGKELFDEKFLPLTDFLSPNEYANLLNTVDVAIFNHRIQEGVGNLLALLYLGKAVFIRSDSPLWEFLSSLGVIVYDTVELINGKVEKISSILNNERISIRNKEIIKEHFSEKNCVKLWNDFFDKISK